MRMMISLFHETEAWNDELQLVVVPSWVKLWLQQVPWVVKLPQLPLIAR
jgi:hypothetical protein